MEQMIASERYEQDWNLYLKKLETKPHLSLVGFLRSRHTNVNGMKKWMERKHLSVREAKKSVLKNTQDVSRTHSQAQDNTSSALFSPVNISPSSQPDERDFLSGICLTFPDGTVVSIKRGSARSVMSFLKLYQREDMLCLD